MSRRAHKSTGPGATIARKNTCVINKLIVRNSVTMLQVSPPDFKPEPEPHVKLSHTLEKLNMLQEQYYCLLY